VAGPGAGLGAGALRPPLRGHQQGAGRRGHHLPRRLRPVRQLLLTATALGLAASPLAAQSPATDDPLLDQQPGLPALSLPEAWPTSTGEGVTIAVLDSGVDADHPDLADHLLPGRDVVDDDDTPADGFGSGTHAAGLAAAVTDNGKGIAGAAPDAMVLPVRVLDDHGAGSPATLASGIAWAAGERAGVIALTLGGDPDLLAHLGDETVQRALRAAIDAGSVVVAGLPTGVDLPDDVPVVLVGDGTGATVDPRVVSAPGDGALSTVPVAPTTLFPDGTDGYESRDGAAAATALVAGTAALLVAEGRTPVEVADLLVGTARNPQGDPALGAGTVDAATAVTQAAQGGAGNQPVPSAEDSKGGLPPAAVGAIAVVAALTAVGATIFISVRWPRPKSS